MKQGWEQKTLADVLDVLRNGVNCKQVKEKVGDKITRIESISNSNFDVDRIGYATLSKSDKLKYRLKKGDILFSHINSPIHVGKTALFNSDEEVYHGVNLLLMRPKPYLNACYFEYYLKFLFQFGYWKGICKQSVNQASVNQQDINKVKINFPKTNNEQLRIVSILDEAFAAIDKAKANAVHNLKNAKELFESYLQSVFEYKGVDWDEKRIGDVLMKTETIDPTKQPNKEFIYIDVSSINRENNRVEKPNTVLGKNAPSRAKKLIRTNDVIFATVRPTLSRVAVITKEYDEQVCSTGYFVLRAKEFISNNFIFYSLLTPNFNKQMEKLQKGASYPAVTDSDVKGIYLAYPKSLKEQRAIVEKLKTLSDDTKKLESIYKKKLEDLEELWKSILQKAFNGEL